MVIPQTNLKRLMQTNLDFDRNVLDHYVEMFNFMIYDSIHQCYSSAYVRLCNFFSIYLENRSQEKVKGNEILLTQEELARIIGVSRVQIGTILNRLRNQKIIETDRRKVIVKDTALLIEQCTEEAYTN
ncbi:MAG: helix-turn-helix domain-containing protein [Clostridia bacterium]|nr:helix-turn-helix domain-containing protein [Clostridia bacterium]